MSLVAIDNALNENVMQKRFLRDRAMGAYRELLQEKVPVGAAVLRQREFRAPEQPGRPPQAGLVREYPAAAQARPACHLVSNGAYVVLCDSLGRSWTRMGETALLRDGGVSVWFSAPGG